MPLLAHATLLVLRFLASEIGLAANPSFDCKLAKSPAEKLICNVPELAQLDVEVSDAFAKLKKQAVGALKEEFVADQKRWLAEVRDCPGKEAQGAAFQSCVKESYGERLKALAPRKNGAFEILSLGSEGIPYVLSPVSPGSKAYNDLARGFSREDAAGESHFSYGVLFASSEVISIGKTNCVGDGGYPSCSATTINFSFPLRRVLTEHDVFQGEKWQEIVRKECAAQAAGADAEIKDDLVAALADFSRMGISKEGFVSSTGVREFHYTPYSCKISSALLKKHFTARGAKLFSP
jgi:uncharacterized protein